VFCSYQYMHRNELWEVRHLPWGALSLVTAVFSWTVPHGIGLQTAARGRDSALWNIYSVINLLSILEESCLKTHWVAVLMERRNLSASCSCCYTFHGLPDAWFCFLAVPSATRHSNTNSDGLMTPQNVNTLTASQFLCVFPGTWKLVQVRESCTRA
jgi:hypothetical protein